MRDYIPQPQRLMFIKTEELDHAVLYEDTKLIILKNPGLPAIKVNDKYPDLKPVSRFEVATFLRDFLQISYENIVTKDSLNLPYVIKTLGELEKEDSMISTERILLSCSKDMREPYSWIMGFCGGQYDTGLGVLIEFSSIPESGIADNSTVLIMNHKAFNADTLFTVNFVGSYEYCLKEFKIKNPNRGINTVQELKSYFLMQALNTLLMGTEKISDILKFRIGGFKVGETNPNLHQELACHVFSRDTHQIFYIDKKYIK